MNKQMYRVSVACREVLKEFRATVADTTVESLAKELGAPVNTLRRILSNHVSGDVRTPWPVSEASVALAKLLGCSEEDAVRLYSDDVRPKNMPAWVARKATRSVPRQQNLSFTDSPAEAGIPQPGSVCAPSAAPVHISRNNGKVIDVPAVFIRAVTAYCQQSRMPIAALSKVSGMNRTTLSEALDGRSKRVSSDGVRCVCEYLGLPSSAVIHGELSNEEADALVAIAVKRELAIRTNRGMSSKQPVTTPTGNHAYGDMWARARRGRTVAIPGVLPAALSRYLELVSIPLSTICTRMRIGSATVGDITSGVIEFTGDLVVRRVCSAIGLPSDDTALRKLSQGEALALVEAEALQFPNGRAEQQAPPAAAPKPKPKVAINAEDVARAQGRYPVPAALYAAAKAYFSSEGRDVSRGIPMCLPGLHFNVVIRLHDGTIRYMNPEVLARFCTAFDLPLDKLLNGTLDEAEARRRAVAAGRFEREARSSGFIVTGTATNAKVQEPVATTVAPGSKLLALRDKRIADEKAAKAAADAKADELARRNTPERRLRDCIDSAEMQLASLEELRDVLSVAKPGELAGAVGAIPGLVEELLVAHDFSGDAQTFDSRRATIVAALADDLASRCCHISLAPPAPV